MSKKIITGIISLVIVIAAINGLSRLRFIERSAMIFKTNSEQNARRGRFERGNRGGRDFRPRQEDFRQRERSGIENLPDSVQQAVIAERDTSTDNNSFRDRQARTFSGDRNDFSNRRPENRGRRGHDFRRGNNIRLGNVSWFFIVFAGFAVFTIYIDLLAKWIKRRIKNNSPS
ncbi:MAG TPA: hypothetical protein VEP89_03740 [Draconibacterium sp.]|nr:hypothetical protein [Draconibacterium sp.]